MTRDSSSDELLVTLTRQGIRGGRIDLADVWPTLVAWWFTPVADLGESEEEEFAFLLRAFIAVSSAGW